MSQPTNGAYCSAPSHLNIRAVALALPLVMQTEFITERTQDSLNLNLMQLDDTVSRKPTERTARFL